ncbi:MAG TPA: hypothetical protein VLB82_07015 [Thermodesulfobacteriota bacterium]|nr:hypothetical protein [Thermodesulfobacteriota bacterium]
MSYLPKEPTTFINIKLTDSGRQLLSLGKLTFDKVALSDREVNYGIDRTGFYDIGCDRILSPKDDNPIFINNFDGTPSVPPQSVGSSTESITAATASNGFFTGTTNNFGFDDNEFKGYGVITYSATTISGNTEIFMTGGTAFPNIGELAFVTWQPPQNSGFTPSSEFAVFSGNPTNYLWYRVMSADTSTGLVSFDRPIPNFGDTSTSSISVNSYFYPYNGVEDYYGSAATVNTKVWNMSITRTSSVIGTDSSISGYTSYGSIEYNGTKQYLGFSSETRAFGVIHYTNEYTGNTYAEQLVEKTVEIDLPTVMWHKFPASNIGEASTWGLKLNDVIGNTIFDSAAGTTYRLLRDGYSTNSKIVGRVYHKLKIFIITDPELLTALSYKSNRNYTLPPVDLDTSLIPGTACSTTLNPGFISTGLLKTGYTYYVTYITESDDYLSGTSFGYPQSLHCGYVSKIDGQVDVNGDPQYLKISFPPATFPYLRSSANMSASSAFSGTGWNANRVQVLVNEVDSVNFPELNTINTVPSDSWVRVSTGKGNGIYTGATGSSTINPLNLAGHQFIVSQEDYNTGSTYVLGSDFTTNNDVNLDGLFFGNESFFYGNVKTIIKATVFKTVITVLAPDNLYNTSLNSSFSTVLDSDTYISEFGVFNNNDVLVAVGKPTYPIKKNSSRYLTFQLEMDF